MANKVTISIAGHEYVMLADESEEYMSDVAEVARQAVIESGGSESFASTRALALATVNLADAYLKAKRENSHAAVEPQQAEPQQAEPQQEEPQQEEPQQTESEQEEPTQEEPQREEPQKQAEWEERIAALENENRTLRAKLGRGKSRKKR